MSSLKVYSVGRLVKYVTDSSLKSLRGNIYRSSVRGYSAEEKAAEDAPGDKQLPTTLEECHKQIESLSLEVTTLKQQAKDYEDKYKRALADGENIRRRMMKQVEDAKSFAIQSFCKDLLDVADTLSIAAESVPERAESNPEGAAAALRSLHDGVRLTRAQLEQSHAEVTLEVVARVGRLDQGRTTLSQDTSVKLQLNAAVFRMVFARHGLVAVSPLREKFDPNLHEALFQQEVEGCEPGTVVAVSKVGYKLHERCVRPALVGVSKG